MGQIAQALQPCYALEVNHSLRISRETVTVELSTIRELFDPGKDLLLYQLFQVSLHSYHFQSKLMK